MDALRSFFYFLTEQEYIDKNPSLSIHTPKRIERFPIYMSESELELFLKTIEAIGKKILYMTLIKKYIVYLRIAISCEYIGT